MAADGGVEFAVRLVNNVTGPARQAQRSMNDLKRTVEDARRAIEAPAPRRAAMSQWDRMTASARRSQARDQVSQMRQIARLNAADAAKRTREAAKAAKIQAAAQIKEQKRVADFHKGMAQQRLDRSAGVADFATGSLQYGAAALAAGALAAAAAVGYLAYQFGKASVEAAVFGERSRLALTLLTGSSKVAAAEFDNVRKEAQQLGLDVYDTQAGFQKLLAAQFDIGKAKELLRMSADLQAIGASADQTKRAIVAISQIKNTGYLQGDELNQLREAGVSTELVYEALGKRLNKTTAQIIKMQEKRQLGSNDVIESILDAVRKKTGSASTGDAGKAFAASTLAGMAGVFQARLQNWFIDIGNAILPGLQRLTKLVGPLIDTLANDPRLAKIGELLLSKFYGFVDWAERNWPEITQKVTNAAALMGSGLETLFELFDTNTWKGKAFVGVMSVIGVVLGLVAAAGFVLMLPLYLLLGAIGVVAYGIYKAVEWIAAAFAKLPKWASVGATAASVVMPGGGFVGGISSAVAASGQTSASQPVITTAAETGPAMGVTSALSGINYENITVASQEQDKQIAQNHVTVNVTADSMTDKAAIERQVKSAVTKALEEHA